MDCLLIVKLLLDVSDIGEMVRVVVDVGVDVIIVVNSMLVMVIDIYSCRPRFFFGCGGLIGLVIRFIVVCLVYDVV